MAPRKKAHPTDDPVPSREAILAFIADQPGKVGKREIARAFGISGADKIALKRVLKEMADEGLVSGRKTRLRRPGRQAG